MDNIQNLRITIYPESDPKFQYQIGNDFCQTFNNYLLWYPDIRILFHSFI